MTLRFGMLVFPSVQQLDLSGPYEIFASVPAAEMHLIWKDRRPLNSATGLILTPTTTFHDCPELDVLCIPGGSGVNALLEDQMVLDFIRLRAPAVRYLTSVCTGALVLGAAGLLTGRRATTHWNALDFLERLGAVVVPERVVCDGNLITAGGVTSGIDFGLTVIAALLGEDEARTIQLALEYAPEPPFGTGTPREAPSRILASARARMAGSRAERELILERIAARPQPA